MLSHSGKPCCGASIRRSEGGVPNTREHAGEGRRANFQKSLYFQERLQSLQHISKGIQDSKRVKSCRYRTDLCAILQVPVKLIPIHLYREGGLGLAVTCPWVPKALGWYSCQRNEQAAQQPSSISLCQNPDPLPPPPGSLY